MAVITISRQFGSLGDDVAARVGQLLGYRLFDKYLMAEVAAEAAVATTEVVDFSEDKYQVRSFLDRVFGRSTPRPLGRVGTWQESTAGERIRAAIEIDETYGLTIVRQLIEAAYERGKVIIVGRGGQVVLKDKAEVLHVRIVAPDETRIQRVHDQRIGTWDEAREEVTRRDRASAEYLRRFYGIDWSEPAHYHLVINAERWGVEGVAQLIVRAVDLQPVVSPKSQAA